jgi:hypothetical protein
MFRQKILIIVLQLPTVFSTKYTAWICSLGAMGCTIQPRCVVGHTVWVCVSSIGGSHDDEIPN